MEMLNLCLPPPTQVFECWSNLNYTWTIQNFSTLSESCWQYSAAFSRGDKDNLKWRLELYLNGSSEIWIGLKLTSEPVNGDKIMGKFKISVLNAEGKKSYSKTSSGVIELKANEEYERLKIGRNDLLNNHLPDDILTIYCEIEVVTNTVDFSGQKGIEKNTNPERTLIADFANLLKNQILSDVKLVIDEVEFPAHKNILAARSDVFKAMFQHDMKETKSGRVVITDVKPEVVQEMLHFIYTGSSPKIKEMAVELFIAADKYALDNLKKMCEIALKEKLSIDRAADTFILADCYNMELLKKETINYIIFHGKEITETIGWEEMRLKHPALIGEILKALFSSTKKQLSISE
ncbi:speckle-type POZ protein-like [Episyrphus balteatus]|uniref:speckle-type POZ protein-like n=1 Tax=Episyrphus balteatus TaxID=286459 RepID=UPI0024866C0A|nr:speckle-type POZ protein-like [Episyrphus balteatus]